MDQFEKLYNRTLHFLSFRPRSEQETREYLKRKSITLKRSEERESLELVIEKIIAKLKEQKFINDEEFVKWWVDQRIRVKPKAIRVIKMELKKKGIHQELIEAAFEVKLNIDTDFKSAKKLAAKKIEKYKNLPRRQFYQKIGVFLSSKGFDYEIIKKVLSDVDE